MSAGVEVFVEVCAAVAAAAVLAGVPLIWRIGRRTKQMYGDWQGEPARPGIEARPGVMERLAAGDRHFQVIDANIAELTATTQKVLDELPKNGIPAAVKLDALYQRLVVQGHAPTEPSTGGNG